MNIGSEKKYLRALHNASRGYGREEFYKLIGPLFDTFLSSGQDSDEYRGWAFTIRFIRAVEEGTPFHDWLFVSKGTDDYAFRIPGRGQIEIHLENWLWFR